jgi:hypothetical protein
VLAYGEAMPKYELRVESPPDESFDGEIVRLRLYRDGEPGQVFNCVLPGLEVAKRGLDPMSAHYMWFREAAAWDVARQIEEGIADLPPRSLDVPSLEPRWAALEEVGLEAGHDWAVTPGQTVYEFDAD